MNVSCELPFALNNLPYLGLLRLSLDTALAFEDGDPLGLWQMSEKARHGTAAPPFFSSPRCHMALIHDLRCLRCPKNGLTFRMVESQPEKGIVWSGDASNLRVLGTLGFKDACIIYSHLSFSPRCCQSTVDHSDLM